MPAVLVTGGGSGIGAEVCRVLAAAGWQVAAADLRPPEGGHELDTTDEAGWERVLDAVWPLDGLVNCAGIRDRAPLEELELAAFERMMAVHVTGCFLGTRGVARRWRTEERSGAVVNISSVTATHAVAGQVHYVTAKGAIAALTRAAAVELGPTGTRVNAIAPGIIRTPMTADRLGDPDQTAWLLSRVPAGRVGEPAEIASAVQFLLSDAASYVNGVLLPVDGGWAAG
ncbi:SDR family oxidoreductase [Geodermatophilus sabuli]|uniref:SDR family oxidoreductase n=1 Tax=Geodermatophilus sabuli TaxID=1564158 RepID=A0A7K3W0N1_9ACTN|nr:SDR family oxidoreductase [Geodermatophilus sabuli]